LGMAPTDPGIALRTRQVATLTGQATLRVSYEVRPAHMKKVGTHTSASGSPTLRFWHPRPKISPNIASGLCSSLDPVSSFAALRYVLFFYCRYWLYSLPLIQAPHIAFTWWRNAPWTHLLVSFSPLLQRDTLPVVPTPTSVFRNGRSMLLAQWLQNHVLNLQYLG